MGERIRQGLSEGQLVTLDLGHGAALEEFLGEFDSNPSELHGYFCDRDASTEDAVGLLDDWSRGERLTKGWVPNSTWFWESDGHLEGVINLRHQLTTSLEETGGHIGYSVAKPFRRRGVASGMLKAVLGECRKLEIASALLTCPSDNQGSVRTIEKHGGVLDREGLSPSAGVIQRWYWINVSDASFKMDF